MRKKRKTSLKKLQNRLTSNYMENTSCSPFNQINNIIHRFYKGNIRCAYRLRGPTREIQEKTREDSYGGTNF